MGEGARRAGGGLGLDRRATFWILYLPPLFWLGAFFLVPLLLMLVYSFRPDMRGDFFQLWQPSFNQYSKLFATGSYWRLLGISTWMALVISIASVVLSYPIAYFLAFYERQRIGF